MATDTQRGVLEYLVDNYGIGRRGTNDTSSSTSAISDDSVFGGQRGAEGVSNGDELLVTLNANSNGNAPEGEVIRLSSRPSLAAGSMNVDPAFTANAETSNTFIILSRPFTFDSGAFAVRQAIDKALIEKIPERLIAPLTMFTDGDMLASGTSDWSETGDGTITKVAASFPLGLRVIRMTGVTADDFIVSTTVPVEENQSYYLEITGMIAPGGADADQGTLILRDLTNGAAITLNETTIDRFEPEILQNPGVTIPSGCEQVEVRLEADNAGDIIDWSNLIFYKNGTREFLVQDRAEVDRLGQLFYASGNRWRERKMVSLGHEPPEQLPSGLWAYHTHGPVSGRALFYEEYRKATALGTTLTNTTSVPKEEVAAVAAWILLEPLLEESRWSGFARKAMRNAAAVLAKYKAERPTVDRAPRSVRLLDV